MAKTQAGLRRTIACAAVATVALGGGVAADFSGVAQASAGVAAKPSAPSKLYRGHELALRRSPGATTAPATGMQAFAKIAGAASPFPGSVDLTRYAEKVGDQGAVGSCAAWALGYGMLGWFSRSQGHSGAPYAPMYVYSQVDGGQDAGASPAAVLDVLRTQGTDTAADYAKGHAKSTTDWKHLPSAAERKNAAANKITGYVTLYNTYGAPGQSAITAVKQALTSGRPVGLAIAVYQPFIDASGPKGLITSTGNLGGLLGYHEVLALGYDSTGVRIENSWGQYWGDGGFATLDWNYIAQHSYEAETIAGFSATTKSTRPLVRAINPAAGSYSGGQLVTVTGSRLSGAIISVSAHSVSPLSVSADGTRLTFRMPAGSEGSSAVRISTPTGVSIGSPLTFHYVR